MFTAIAEGDGYIATYVIMGQAKATGFTKGFQSHRDVDAIPQQVFALRNNVTDVDPDAKTDLSVMTLA